MPPVVAGAAISGAAALGGGVLQGRSQNKATKASMDAQNQALAYEKEKDAQRKAEYDQAKAQFEQQQAFNWKIKQGVLARYGVKLPDMPAGPSQGAPGRPPVTLGTIAGPARGMMPSNATQDAPPPGVAPQGPMQAPTLEGWEDWRKYNAAV